VVKHRFRAQALVEFSLVIVLLLVLIFGILEVGRLLFVYAAVITSSREAVRYGSAAGINEAGNLYYQDCVGIRNTARKLAFFQNLQDDDILIEYDTGPGTTVIEYCDPLVVVDGVDESVNPSFDPGNPDLVPRIRVTITASFTAIVPIIPIRDMPIESSSVRTIMGIITLE